MSTLNHKARLKWLQELKVKNFITGWAPEVRKREKEKEAPGERGDVLSRRAPLYGAAKLNRNNAKLHYKREN